MKQAAWLLAILSAITWTACGGGNNNSAAQVSNIKDRALFTNAVPSVMPSVGILDIDANPPTLYQSSVAALSMPEQMLLAPDRSFVLIYDDAAHNISIFSSGQETVVGALSLNFHTESIVMSSDGKHAYAAVPDNPEQTPPFGAMLSFDLTTGTSGAQVAVPNARRLALSGDGKSLLVFGDDTDTAYYIDLTATSFTAVPITGLNRPYTAYFASDNQTAYILNCGTECSGASAPSVQPVTITPTAQTKGTAIPVPGATVGLLDGTTLYVAGNDVTKPSGSQGVFTTVNLSSGTASAPVSISDGTHNKLVSNSNKFWIGASNCSDAHCLSIVDSSGQSADRTTLPTGDVTAFTPVNTKKAMFVMQGGQLYQFDPNTLSNFVPFDIVGQGWDIKLLDQ